jgi:hypothetical protein
MISTLALAFKAIRRLYPDYPLWRDFAYEYEQGKLAIDVINGGPLLRDWVDAARATPQDLDSRAIPDEQAWFATKGQRRQPDNLIAPTPVAKSNNAAACPLMLQERRESGHQLRSHLRHYQT